MLGEIAAGFMSVHGSEKARDKVGPLPFTIFTYARSAEVSLGTKTLKIDDDVRRVRSLRFHAALLERSFSQERFRIHPSLESRGSSFRADFTQAMEGIIRHKLKGQEIVDELDWLARETYDGSDIPGNIANLLAYTRRYNASKVGDFGSHGAQVAQNAKNIMKVFIQLKDKGEKIPEIYFELFAKVSSVNMGKVGQIMDLFRDLQVTRPAFALPISTIIRLYRNEMHKTLGTEAGVGALKSSKDLYDTKQYDADTLELVSSALNNGADNWLAPADAFGLPMPKGPIRVGPGKNHSRAGEINWPSFWSRVFQKLSSDQFVQQLSEIRHIKRQIKFESTSEQDSRKMAEDLFNLVLRDSGYVVVKDKELVVRYEKALAVLRGVKEPMSQIEKVSNAVAIQTFSEFGFSNFPFVRSAAVVTLGTLARLQGEPIGIVKRSDRKKK